MCISIRGPDVADLDVSPRFAAVLRLVFADLERPSPDPEDVIFAAEHAKAILDFIREWQDVDRIVVHCQMGLSRSPGVALGLCDVFGWPIGALERDYPLWNRRVRSELLRIGHEMVRGSDP